MEKAVTIASSNNQVTKRTTLPITTLRSLVTVRQSEAYKGLSTGNTEAIVKSVGHNVAAILDCPNIAMLKRMVDPLTIEIFLAAEIKKLTDIVNIDQRLNIQAEQIPMIAGQLIELFPVESIEDFVLCFKRGATGFYGSIFRLDAAVLIEWFRKYLDEKYSLVEARIQKDQDKAKEENKIDYAAFAARKAKELATPTPNNKRDNDYEVWKLEKNTLQKLINVVTIEFYNKQGKDAAKMPVWVEEQYGLDIPAENEKDAEEIYSEAKSRRK